MLKSSVSKVKQFYNFSKGLYGITHQDVCDTVMGVKKDTYEKNMGTLADAYIMDSLGDSMEYVKLCRELQKTLTIDSERILEAWVIDFSDKHPLCTTQVSNNKTYSTLFGDIDISMRLDILTPNLVTDIKCSKYGIDPATYLDDLQGKIYTNAFEVDFMAYEHFKFSIKTDEVQYEGRIEQPYCDDKEIVNILNQYISFVRRNNLENFITV